MGGVLDWSGDPGLLAIVIVWLVLDLAVLAIPAVFFLLNLRDLLREVNAANRSMSPDKVWLNLIPVFGIGWFVYTVVKIRESVLKEYQARRWKLPGDLGYNVGIAAAILSLFALVFAWFPMGVYGSVVTLGALVCWVMYWVRTSGLRTRLARGVPPFGSTPASPGSRDRGSWPTGGSGAVCGHALGGRDIEMDSWEDDEGAPGDIPSCPGCGSECEVGDRFCMACGRRLPQ